MPLRQRQHGDRWCAASEFGLLVIEREAPPVDRAIIQPTWEYFDTGLPRRWPARWRWLGFDAYRGATRHYVRLPPTPYRGVQVPHWAVVVLSCALPGHWLTAALSHSRARRRARRGLCAACGYDLTANASGVCPECGTGCGTECGAPLVTPAAKGAAP